MSRFKYLGCTVSYECEYDVKEKTNTFRNICGTIHRNLEEIKQEIAQGLNFIMQLLQYPI